MKNAAVGPKISAFPALVNIAIANEHRTGRLIIPPSRTAACLTI